MTGKNNSWFDWNGVIHAMFRTCFGLTMALILGCAYGLAQLGYADLWVHHGEQAFVALTFAIIACWCAYGLFRWYNHANKLISA